MNWTFFAGLLLVNTLIAIFMAILLSRKRAAPGSQAMMMMFVSLAIWTLGYAMIIPRRCLPRWHGSKSRTSI
jgi:hypothetical protein